MAGGTMVSPMGALMSTTSLKLPEHVKELVAVVARQEGVTPHAFMVEAIRLAALAAEKRAGFVSDALASRAEAIESAEGFPATEVHAYLRNRVQGKTTPKLRARTWRS